MGGGEYHRRTRIEHTFYTHGTKINPLYLCLCFLWPRIFIVLAIVFPVLNVLAAYDVEKYFNIMMRLCHFQDGFSPLAETIFTLFLCQKRILQVGRTSEKQSFYSTLFMTGLGGIAEIIASGTLQEEWYPTVFVFQILFFTVSNVGLVFSVKQLLRFNLRKLKKDQETARLKGDSRPGHDSATSSSIDVDKFIMAKSSTERSTA